MPLLSPDTPPPAFYTGDRAEAGGIEVATRALHHPRISLKQEESPVDCLRTLSDLFALSRIWPSETNVFWIS